MFPRLNIIYYNYDDNINKISLILLLSYYCCFNYHSYYPSILSPLLNNINCCLLYPIIKLRSTSNKQLKINNFLD